MSVLFTMSGLLEGIKIDDDFVTVINELNMAAAQGKAFALTRQMNGEPIAIKIDNILTISGLDYSQDQEEVGEEIPENEY